MALVVQQLWLCVSTAEGGSLVGEVRSHTLSDLEKKKINFFFKKEKWVENKVRELCEMQITIH